MSEKMTRLLLRGSNIGIMEWGEKTPEEMLHILREYSSGLRKEAAMIDATPDINFQIDIVRGVHVQHHIRNLQPGKIISNGSNRVEKPTVRS